MVKGLSRRVIVIKTPDPRIFEEAIFLVRDDVLSRGVTQAEILREAQTVAAEYVRAHRRQRKKPRLSAPLYALGGAGAVAVLWAAAQFLF